MKIGNANIAKKYCNGREVKKEVLNGVEIYSSVSLPVKGDIINMNVGVSATSRFRVLSIDGTIAKVLSLQKYTTSLFNATSKTASTPGMSRTYYQKYDGSTLDTLLNTTYYNSLSSAAKAAIVATTSLQQDITLNSSSSSTKTYKVTISSDHSNDYYLNDTYLYSSTVTIGTRYVYALSVTEIAEYFNLSNGGTITTGELAEMFNVGEKYDYKSPNCCLLRTAYNYYTNSSNEKTVAIGGDGNFYTSTYCGFYVTEDFVNSNNVNKTDIRPVFKIDLSKISYSIE